MEEDGTMWRTILAVIAIVFSAAPSLGAPIVAKVLSYTDGGTQFSSLPASLPFDFRIYEPTVSPTLVYTSWRQNYSPADVGKSFFAPPEIIVGATAARNSTTALVVLEITGSGAFHSTPEPWWLGFPAGHYITAIERIVDNLVITPVDQTRYTVQFAQRVRIWTEPIPEPRTVALCAIVVSLASTYRLKVFCRRRPRFHL
jgi:hypothetical protein